MTPMIQAAMLSALGLAVASLAQAQTPSLRADLAGYQVTELSTLPPAPAGQRQDCTTPPAQHPAGKAVAAAGWQVVSESRMGGHGVVSFAAGSSQGPQGTCDFDKGNLGIFRDDRLVGLYWSSDKDDRLFGPLQADGDGRITIRSATFPVVPVAELAYREGGFVLQALPATLTGCEGRAEVPQLWLEPIGKMRAQLIASGWTPVPAAASDPIAADMQARGFPEAESCSGTGQNHCSFDYASPQAKLRIITLGEMGDDYQPMVADLELTCLAQVQ